MREAAFSCKRGKVLRQVTGVIGLVKALREQFQHPIVIRLVAILQRVKEHESASGLKHARELGKRLAPNFGWQFVKQEYTCECILARVRQRNGLGFGDQEMEPAPALEMASG